MQQNRFVAVGAFLVLGLALFAVGLFLIGDRRMLFDDSFQVYAEFSDIGGLQNGAVVRVGGMDAGEVDQINVPAGPSAKFRVRMRVREDLRPLMRLDSVASIQNDGLVGNRFVQVDPGTDASPQVSDGGTIRSREPFDLADMFDRLSETIDLITAAITDVRKGVDEALSTLTLTAADARGLIGDVGSQLRAVSNSSRAVAADLQAILQGVREGHGTVGKFVNDDEFYNRVKGIATEAEIAIRNLREATQNAKSAIEDFRGEEGPARGMVAGLQQSLTLANETLTDLAASSEALKRNFFFRGFFNRRGFFDLDDISVEEYRQGALETNDRRVLRVWVSAQVLFETDAAGREVLTADGRARLDSAMATFVGYPPDTPFVIEGYAAGVTRDVQFIRSRTRAELVRGYVAAKFGLNSGYVTTMPMGPEAPGSPGDGRWEGVALAAFVQKARE
jgi:phospholipid/cholesterol/gamma-HCH transport system substrate-binding protein